MVKHTRPGAKYRIRKIKQEKKIQKKKRQLNAAQKAALADGRYKRQLQLAKGQSEGGYYKRKGRKHFKRSFYKRLKKAGISRKGQNRGVVTAPEKAAEMIKSMLNSYQKK